MASVERCKHYGRFMSGLKRPQAEGLYWGFFSMVIVLLFACSWNYGRTMERIEGLNTDDERRQRLLRRGFWTSLAGGLVACSFGVLAAFTLLTLQFCDGEPLASLYWSTWTVLVVGGIVAIFGISLHIRNLIKSRRLPPWALALGTPVLVVAGLGHYFQGKLSRKARRIAERVKNKNDGTAGVDISETPTVRESSVDSGPRQPPPKAATEGSPYMKDELSVKVVRVTEDGDMVIRISPEIQQRLAMQFQMSSTTLAGPHENGLTTSDIPKTANTAWSLFSPDRRESS